MVQVRISASGVQALEDNAADLITNLVGEGGLTFEVPPDCGGNPALCCDCDGNVISPCGPVDIDITEQAGDPPRLEVNPVTGQSRLDLTVRARVRTQNAVPFCFDTVIDVECNAGIDTTDSGNDSIRLQLGIDLVQNAQSGTTDMVVSDVQLNDLDSGDIDLSGGFLCTIGELGIGFFIDSLTSPLEDTVAETLADQVCKQCPTGTVDECGVFADACEGGVCMQGGQCIQELGISGRLLSQAVLGAFSPGTLGGMDMYQVAGGYASTDGGGLSLGMLGGFLPAGPAGAASAERARCGPPAAPPPVASAPVSNFFQGNARPDTGDPFDVAIGLHQQNLDLAAWSAYEGGFLCLNVGTSAVDLLTTDTLSLLMPSVLELMHGTTGQIVLGIRPQAPPQIRLGTGASDNDPLLTVAMPGVEVDFFSMVDDQFIRIMTIQSDLALPLDLEVDGNGALVPVIGDLADAFQNVTVNNSEALLESPEEIAGLFPTLIAAAGPALGGGLDPIELPDLGGLTVQVDDITAVENNSFLAIFGQLAVAQPTPARQPRIETSARIANVRVPDTDAFRDPRTNRALRPALELELAAEVPAELTALADPASGGGLEWQVRVDGGMWSPYGSDARPALSREVFWLQGVHTVEVRARVVGRPQTADLTPVVLTAAIDTIPPQAVLARPTPDAVWVMGSDNVTRGAMQASWRLGDGAWHTAPVPARIDLASLGAVGADSAGDSADLAELEVILRDQAGNESHSKALIDDLESRFHGQGEGGCECSSADPGGAAAPLALLLLGWLLLLARRERLANLAGAVSRAARGRVGSWLSMLAVVLALAAAGSLVPACSCGGANGATTDFPNPVGRFSAIAADGDRVVISAYDDIVGDLVLIERAGDKFTARFVDGLPPGAEPVEPGAYRDGITDPGPDVGAFTAVALREGRALIAYQDVDNAQLKFAAEAELADGADDTGFAIHVVDAGDDAGGSVQVGLHNALALSASGAPAIAYLAVGVDDGTGGLSTQLRLAEASSPDPRGAGDWTITVIDEAPISCAGLCGAGTQCAIQAGVPRCLQPTDDCADCGADDVCVAATCLAGVAAPPAYDVPQGVGLFVDVAYLPDGRPVVVYYDRVAGDLVLGVRDGEAFTRQVLDGATSSDVGQWADLAVDDAGTVHVAYQDAIADQLLYVTWDSGSGEAGPVEVVDDGVREGDRPHPVGASAAIFATRTSVGVLYQDGATADVMLARREAGGWATEPYRAGPELHGFFIAAALAGDTVHASFFAYDRAVVPSGRLDISTVK